MHAMKFSELLLLATDWYYLQSTLEREGVIAPVPSDTPEESINDVTYAIRGMNKPVIAAHRRTVLDELDRRMPLQREYVMASGDSFDAPRRSVLK